MSEDPAVHARLRALSVAYATGVDRRDRDRLLSAFHPDAALAVVTDGGPHEPRRVLRGHAELGRIVELIARFPKTFHMLGQASYQVEGGDAEGEVYCIAHHLDPAAGGGATMVMYIRYLDRYRADDGGVWRIVERRVVVDWQATYAHRPGAAI